MILERMLEFSPKSPKFLPLNKVCKIKWHQRNFYSA